ncbi:MAG TPA: hypothetical protein PL037_09070, partial [Elusimicrobiales bacterium]|nr:hypothetical protein [Elusimicrobiales bacterium]
MLSRRTQIYVLLLLSSCSALAYGLAREWERMLQPRPGTAPRQRAQAAGGFREMRRDRVEKGTAQRIWQSGDAYNAEYNFINFNRDGLGVSYGMKAPEFRDYMSGYGYTDREMDAIRAWKDKAHVSEWDRAYRAGGEPAAKKAIQDVAMDYDLKVRKLLLQRGFALRKGNVVECDMPNVVKRNTAVLKPLALAFQKIASDKSYGAEDTVGAVLSMVQTAIRYQIPPMVENGRHIGGLLPPVKALLSGWGDCDTKTGVAAS